MKRVKFLIATLLSVATVAGSQSVCFAGAVGVPRFQIADVAARTYDSYTVAFNGGQPAVVRMHGDGSTLLLAEVFDQNGHLIVSGQDVDGTGIILTFNPIWTGPFIIRISNLGYAYNHYTIETN